MAPTPKKIHHHHPPPWSPPPPPSAAPTPPLSTSCSESRKISETASFFPALTSSDSAFSNSISSARSVNPDALLSVYVRPAGSYVMDQLQLRRVTCYPGVNATDIVILVGSFSVATGFRTVEAVFSNHKVEVIAECKAMVFPMVKPPFVVGFLVAEFPRMEMQTPPQNESCDLVHQQTPEDAYGSARGSDVENWDIQCGR